jgi:FkbM family methyltransferase
MSFDTKQFIYEALTSPFMTGLMRPLGIYPFPRSHARHLIGVLRKLQIDCVLDVGGHFGEFGKYLRGMGYGGEIVSFEPVRASFQLLAETSRKDARWRCMPFALGTENGEAEIHLYEGDTFNSMLSPSGEAVRYRHYMEERGTETIQIRTLDSLYEELSQGAKPPRLFLKMDTQGYDVQVFRGGGRVLPLVLGLQSELPGLSQYKEQTSMSDALAEYRAGGFRPTGFFPVATELDGLTVVEWDCVLTRHA